MAKDQTPDTPLNPTDFMILVAVANQPLHGYAIARAVEQASDGRVTIGLGSLYRFIARLMNAGLIKETDPPVSEPHAGRKRRVYEITDAGRTVAAAEARRMRDAVALARSENLLADDRS